MTRHNQYIVDLRALYTRCGKLGLLGNLRFILVEVLRQSNNGLLDKLKITCSAHDNSQSYGVIGLCLALVQLSRDIEVPHSTRERCRALRKRINLNLYARSFDLLLHLYVTRTAIEECLERIDITILLNHYSLEGDSRNLELASSLREHDILAPSAGAIRATVNSLDGK